jgi:hypothetical protein
MIKGEMINKELHISIKSASHSVLSAKGRYGLELLPSPYLIREANL